MSLIVTPGQLSRRAELYHQLGSMLGAGVPLLKALEMASRNPAVRSSRKTIHELSYHLQSGLTFSESMNRVQGGWMPEFDVALLSVGEHAGRLETSFKLLSVYYSSRASVIRDTIVGLLITMATLHVFLLVFPLSYLVMFAQGIIYADYERCIPFLLEKLVAFGLLYTSIFFLIFACQGRRGEGWRSIVEAVVSPIPLLGAARKYLVLSRLAGALEAATTAGMSIVKGWEMAGAASGSPRLQREVSHWRSEIDSGATPGELISKSSYFPDMFVNLYNTGEQTGQLDDALKRLQSYYQDEGFRRLRFFTRVMNGTIYGLVAMLVAYNVIRFYVLRFAQLFQQFQ